MVRPAPQPEAIAGPAATLFRTYTARAAGRNAICGPPAAAVRAASAPGSAVRSAAIPGTRRFAATSKVTRRPAKTACTPMAVACLATTPAPRETCAGTQTPTRAWELACHCAKEIPPPPTAHPDTTAPSSATASPSVFRDATPSPRTAPARMNSASPSPMVLVTHAPSMRAAAWLPTGHRATTPTSATKASFASPPNKCPSLHARAQPAAAVPCAPSAQDCPAPAMAKSASRSSRRQHRASKTSVFVPCRRCMPTGVLASETLSW